MIGGALLFFAAVALAVMAAVWRSPTWTLPLLGGAVVALLLSLYQRWWVRTNFPGDPDVLPARTRRQTLRGRVHLPHLRRRHV